MLEMNASLTWLPASHAHGAEQYASVPALQRNSMWEKEAVLFPNQRWSREASSVEISTLFIQAKLDSESCSWFWEQNSKSLCSLQPLELVRKGLAASAHWCPPAIPRSVVALDSQMSFL